MGLPMTAKRRSFRELQADAAREAEGNGPHHCPSCGHTWQGPSGPPARNLVAEAARAAALISSGHVFAIEIANTITAQDFGVWIAPTQLIDGTSRTVDLAAPPELAHWIRERFQPALDRAAAQLAGTGMTCRVLDGLVPDTPTLGQLLEIGPAAQLGGKDDRPTPILNPEPETP